ncbi:MAG: hypothetical protein QOJ89_543 [bacterium]
MQPLVQAHDGGGPRVCLLDLGDDLLGAQIVVPVPRLVDGDLRPDRPRGIWIVRLSDEHRLAIDVLGRRLIGRIAWRSVHRRRLGRRRPGFPLRLRLPAAAHIFGELAGRVGSDRGRAARTGERDIGETRETVADRHAPPITRDRPFGRARLARSGATDYTTSPWRSVFSVTTRGSTKCSR